MSRPAQWALHLLLAAAGLSMLDPGASHAQVGQDARAEEAIQKGREGVTLYERGEWQAALTAFRKADALFHSPVLTLYAARALRNLGKLVEAKRVYQTLAREVLDASAPRPWAQAQLDGNAELRALDAETPRLVIDAPRDASTSIDGTAVMAGELMALDPGEHMVEVAGAAGRTSKKVMLRRGDGTTRIAMQPPPPRQDAGTDAYTIVGIVLTGVGGAALATGGVVGIVALNDASSAEAKLPASCTSNRECLPSASAGIEAEYESAYTTASLADGLFIGGGIAAVAGIAILIIDPGGAPRVQATATRRGGGLRVTF